MVSKGIRDFSCQCRLETFIAERNNGFKNKQICKLITTTTPWSRDLPEKLKRPELLKKFPAFYGTRRFITAFTRARHLSLS
jgi:hypothetical protein